MRDIVEFAKKKYNKNNNSPVSIAKSVQDDSGLLFASHPKNKLVDLISSDELKSKLERLVKEQRFMAKLKSHGLSLEEKFYSQALLERVKHSPHLF